MYKPHMKSGPAYILSRFGNAKRLARLMDIPPTTVQKWYKSGWIPYRRLAHVLEVGKQLKPPLKWADFEPPLPQSRSHQRGQNRPSASA
jgi:hypothetical protein